jgi:4-hydroxy-tetrahydrodipicolinate reductase
VKPIHLSVCGAAGRMGARILALAAKDSRFQPVAGVGRKNGQSVGRFAADGRTPIVGDIQEVLAKTDAVIDFSTAEAAVPTAQRVARAGRALVVGTTGLRPGQIKKLRTLARRIPIVFSPNMSVGMNVLFELVAKAAAALAQYDIEIVEAHHNLKKDAPSGSALKLANVAAESSRRRSQDFVYGREGLVGARTKKEIGISAIRAGDIVGDHTVFLAGPGERLELTHRAHSRDAFASGALEAAAWAVRQKPGFYSMKDVLKFK